MSTLFITGATGFVGKNLTQELLPHVEKIYLLIRRESLEKAQAIFHHQKIEFIIGDITRSNVVESKEDLEKLQSVSKVLHIAASYDLADEDFNAFDKNVIGTQNIIKLIDNLPLVKYFFYTSSYVVNGDKAQEYCDDDLEELNRENEIYALTKNQSERLVREAAKKRSINTVILRPGIVLGSTVDDANFKPDGPYFFIKFLMQKKRLIQRLEFAKVLPFYFKESSPLPFVSIDYLCNWIREIVLHPKERPISTYHLFDVCPVTTQEFMDLVCHYFEFKVRIVPVSVGGKAFSSIFTYLNIPKNLLKYMNLSASYRVEKLFSDYPQLKKYSFKEHSQQFFRSAEKGMM